MKIYKYFSSSVIDLVFQREGFCGLKCSLPKEYNDPYELFLGLNFDVPTECLATYRDIVQVVPQYPTTCFSKSPIVSPMWAHYAQNHSGFVLEFDVEKLRACFEEVEIRDVDYKSEPNPALAESLMRVTATKKPRHAVWLRQAVLTEAYFSKYRDWSYEQECRLVDRNRYVEVVGGNDILFIPSDCITAMIVGNKYPENQMSKSVEVAGAQGVDWFQLCIGKSFPLPFMVAAEGSTFTFGNGKITEALRVCEDCCEPLLDVGDLCAWCSITDSDAEEAARGNPFRVLDHYGMLEDYLATVRDIEKGKKS
ncbi:DUF2971 domain-containing protein [Ruegeria arenilitoris]|uniref:DUF2971 domain-containing protein n=1 Tax=Ruegeria arenilitoris TaxID=1173585 RepID=UPI0014814FE5|nr:DUF2971 domain-containing protein [Ruegeria arenilitoris]